MNNEEKEADPFAEILNEDVVMKDQNSPSKEAFPSLFNSASTPRVNNDDNSDIRMSFPSQEMWGNNFEEKKEESKEKDNKKGDWGSGTFDFKPSEDIKNAVKEPEIEEDGFQDIMDLKRDVKEITKHEEFGGFSDPIKAENKSEEIAKDKNQEGEIIFGNFGSAEAQTEGWGNFKVENQEKISQEVKEDGWATFTDPVNQNELANENKDESKKVPFASDEDPFKDAFPTENLDKQPEEKDSDFGDFEDPIENIPSTSDFKVSEDIQNSEAKI